MYFIDYVFYFDECLSTINEFEDFNSSKLLQFVVMYV